MLKLLLYIMLGGSTLFAESHLQYNEAVQRRIALDSGLNSLENQASAIKLQSIVSNAMAPTSFETNFEDFGLDEIEFSISQDFEHPAILRKRQALIAADVSNLSVDVQEYHLKIRSELNMFFLDAAITSKQRDLAVQRVDILKQMLKWQTRQFQEGALSESELIRTQLSVAEMSSEIHQVNATLVGIASELSAYLDSSIQVAQLPTNLPDLPEHSKIVDFWEESDHAPQMRRQEAIINRAIAQRNMAETPMVSAVSLRGGYKLLPELDKGYPVVGISLIAPLFSKRSVSVKLQDYQLKSARDDQHLLMDDLRQYSIMWQARWQSERVQLENLQTSLIPKAEQLYAKIDEEYRSGARRYLEVLDAQSLLYDFQEESIDLEHQLVTSLLEMNNIIGVTVYEFE